MTDVGRPTEYKEDYVNKLLHYIEHFEEYGEAIPKVEGFALIIDVSKKSIYNWAEKHPEFLHALSKLKDKQANVLQDKGLTGKFNSTITKLLLSANHNISEKQDIELGGKLAHQIIGMKIIKDEGDNIQNEEPETD